jgi:hypothetical protein
MSYRILTSTMLYAMAFDPGKSPISPITPGRIRPAAAGPRTSALISAAHTVLTEIKRWLEVFLFQVLRNQSIRDRLYRMGRRFRPAARCRRVATGVLPSDGNARVWIDELHANVP